LLEVSIKAPVVQAAAAIGGFMAFLAEVGAERDNEQQTKTRWALEFYAGKLARKAPRKAPRTAPRRAPRTAPGGTSSAKGATRKQPSTTRKRARPASRARG